MNVAVHPPSKGLDKGEALTRLSALVHLLFRGLALPFEFNKHTGKDAIYRNASLATNCHSP